MFPSSNPVDRSSSALIALFLESRADTCNEASQATYVAYIRQFDVWLAGRPISALTIGAYFTYLRSSRALATATMGNHYRMLKTMGRWLFEFGYIDRDPFVGPGRVKPPAQKRKRRKVYTDEQVIALLMTAHNRIIERTESQRWRPSPNPYLLRDALQCRALILLLSDSALRAAEVSDLKCGQVRAEEFIVLGKGGHEDAAFISEVTRTVLIDLAGDRPDDKPLFVDVDQKKCTTVALRGCLRRMAARAGVDLVERPLHAFRHMTARNWLKSGLQDLTIRQLMRHSQLSTTRLYTELDAAELAAIHARVSPIARLLAAAEEGADEGYDTD